MTAARKKFAPGDRVFNWKLLRQIGQGGMGVVFLAQHSLTGREAAVKIIYPPAGVRADEAAVTRFRNEIEVHVRLKMPNLPEFIQAEMDDDGTCILILEYIEGTDLERLLRAVKKLPLGDALFIALEILRPLAVIHHTSIHRDIKPPNIMIRRKVRYDSAGNFEKGFVVLMDFGITKHQDRKGPTRENTIIGSRFYMSPEQFRGLELTPKSDIYSLGIVVYEMLSGGVLYVNDAEEPPELIALLYNHVHTPPPPIAGLPDEVWSFLERMLAKDPALRPTALEAHEACKELRAKHLATSRIFCKDVTDVAEATRVWMAERAAEGVAIAPPPELTQGEDSATATTEEMEPPIQDPTTEPDAVSPASNAPSPPTVATEPVAPQDAEQQVAAAFARPPRAPLPSLEPNGAPARGGYQVGGSVGTYRMVDAHGGKPGRPPTDRELRTVRWIRDALRGPRLFRRPAVLPVDARGKAEGELCEVTRFPFTLGGSYSVDMSLRAAGPVHASLSLASDRRLFVRPPESVLVHLAIDGREAPAGGELWHGVTVELGRARFVVHDLVAHDPRSGRAQRFRQRKEPAGFIFSREGMYVASASHDFQFLLVGSSPACDIVLEEAGEIVAVILKRADGEFEVASLDSSALPYGQAITGLRFLFHSESVDLGRGYQMKLSDPPETSSVISLAMAEPQRSGSLSPEPRQVATISRSAEPAPVADAPGSTWSNDDPPAAPIQRSGIAAWFRRLFS